MPSDPRIDAALAALAEPREAFRSAVARTAEEVRGLLQARETPEVARETRLAEELGAFAAGRIDTGRLAEVLVEPHRVGTAEASEVEGALSVLRSLQDAGDHAFVVRIERGGSLEGGAAAALADLGRAFGAARVVELVRDGLSRGPQREALERFGFERWNRAERGLAPPLVVRVEGADLSAGGLARFLDGGQKLVLVVDGPAPPAPLVRLITPGVLVVQTDDASGLGRLAGFHGPAVAALMPETAARFIHDPAAPEEAGRLTVEWVPDVDPDGRIGSASAFQQAEERDQLRVLAAAAPGADKTAAATSGSAEPADRAGVLAAWLLGQADVTDLTSEAG